MSLHSRHAHRIQYLETTLNRHMSRYGYNLIEIPVIEQADLFLTRAGDNLIDRLFTFERLGKQFALRPEFTAAAARHYLELEYNQPVRWQFRGNIFEDVPGRYSHEYHRVSIGAEFIGQPGSIADAEIISMAAQGFQSLGLRNWKLVIGHTGLQNHLLQRQNLDYRTVHHLLTYRHHLREMPVSDIVAMMGDFISEYPDVSEKGKTDTLETQQMLDVLLNSTRYGTTMGGRSRYDIAARLLRKRERALQHDQIVQALEFLKDWTAISSGIDDAFPRISTFIADDDVTGQQILMDWQKTVHLLTISELPLENIIIQPDLARNWEYYTGIVFGIRLEGDDNDTYAAGGGRYDELLRLIGARQMIPAVGFAYYGDVILPELTSPEAETTPPLYLTFADAQTEQAIMLANHLRRLGISVALIESDSGHLHEALHVSDDGCIEVDSKRYDLNNLNDLVKHIKAGI